jgi:plastocyanin
MGVLAAPAAAVQVNAEGNAFTGGLKFAPASITVSVGQRVTWLNTDFVVPHTATQNNRLWDLGGTYGATPLNPAGFGPDTTVGRRFEAGTQEYFCRVHPTQMKGVVRVPVALRLARFKTKVRVRVRTKHGIRHRRRTKRLRYLVATWAPRPPSAGLVFDVERKRDGGAWKRLRTGTTKTDVRFRPRGHAWSFRARLRKASSGAATGWSPVASLQG